MYTYFAQDIVRRIKTCISNFIFISGIHQNSLRMGINLIDIEDGQGEILLITLIWGILCEVSQNKTQRKPYGLETMSEP